MKPYKCKKLPLKLNWNKLIPFIGDARAGVAGFDGRLKGIPNPAVLLSPLTTNEAVLSSKIEGTIDTLFCYPYFTTTQFIKHSNIPKPTADRILKKLSKSNIIKLYKKSAGRKPTVYIFPKLLNIVS